jgi:hypothetical protein
VQLSNLILQDGNLMGIKTIETLGCLFLNPVINPVLNLGFSALKKETE